MAGWLARTVPAGQTAASLLPYAVMGGAQALNRGIDANDGAPVASPVSTAATRDGAATWPVLSGSAQAG
ncbi:hypothetical protein DF3PA_190054 [Candidatus Defluviicoccus seviourii]|uniref:Uncharacterized protein n=1 Tax=Candidatus Defluviicoccus seviourii TaxID=2565273 RepID=A0A564WDN8_9PROT|nr:hypothetical protein DF3PA_190054 [Candidatus Defluviicoccus seviourii]